MRHLFIRMRFLLVLFVSRRAKLYDTIRLFGMLLRQNGFRAIWQKDTWLLLLGQFKIRYLINHLSQVGDYQAWVKNNELSRFDLFRQRKQGTVFQFQPTISFVTPVFNPAPDVLEDTIKSVLAQTYSNWELCLANGCPENQEVRTVLTRFKTQDHRISVVELPENLGISGNTNAALERARGEFVSFLDHDDLIAPDMLYEVVRALNQDRSIEVIYFDEDTISAEKIIRRFPWFKPGASSPDLMLSTNYLMHSIVRRDLVFELGCFDSSMDGAQDWDLAFKLIERKSKMKHIPRVFYHWRAIPGSVASDANAKPWAFQAQKRCIEAHLLRQKISTASVDIMEHGLVHINWSISGDKVSIIIPTKDNVAILKSCLISIHEKTDYPNYEIILVDNGSIEPETQEFYRTMEDNKAGNAPSVMIISYPRPFNFHIINNLGARNATGQILVFLNNDTEVIDPGWLRELVGWVERPEIGIVGAKLLRPNQTIQHAGIVMGLCGHGSHVFDGGTENMYGPFGSSEWYRDFQAVTGACVAIRRNVFEELGGFDEIYQVGYGDIDLCLRCSQIGYRVVYTPFCRLIHHEGASRGLSQPPSDVLRATIKMYAQATSEDPFYNPNLSHLQRIPTLRQKGEEPREWRLLNILRDFDLVHPQALGIAKKERWQVDLNELHPELDLSSGKPRVLLITHELSRSGAPILLLRLAKFLSKRGYQVTVLSPAEGNLRQSYEEAGIQVLIVYSLLRDARITVPYLHVHDLVIANTILAYRVIHAARAFEKPSIWWIHESTFGQQFVQENPAAFMALKNASAVVFVSQDTANLYNTTEQNGNRHTLLTGFDVDKPDPLKYPLQTSVKSDHLNIVQIATIEHRKAQDVLLQAIATLPDDVASNISCYLIGRRLDTLNSDRKYSREIRHLAKKLKNIYILGELTEQEVLSFLDTVDVFVLPSRDEALPLSMIEAMAYGKAIIASRVGGVPEIIDDEVNGLLVEQNNPLELSHQILRLYRDRQFMTQLGSNARKTYQDKLTFSIFSSNFLKIMEKFPLGHREEDK